MIEFKNHPSWKSFNETEKKSVRELSYNHTRTLYAGSKVESEEFEQARQNVGYILASAIADSIKSRPQMYMGVDFGKEPSRTVYAATCYKHGATEFTEPNANGDSYCRRCTVDTLRDTMREDFTGHRNVADLVKFRFHRGGLQESMATMVEDTPEKIRELIFKEFPGKRKLESEPYGRGRDERVGWENLHIVLLDGHPVGFANGSVGVGDG